MVQLKDPFAFHLHQFHKDFNSNMVQLKESGTAFNSALF